MSKLRMRRLARCNYSVVSHRGFFFRFRRSRILLSSVKLSVKQIKDHASSRREYSTPRINRGRTASFRGFATLSQTADLFRTDVSMHRRQKYTHFVIAARNESFVCVCTKRVPTYVFLRCPPPLPSAVVIPVSRRTRCPDYRVFSPIDGGLSPTAYFLVQIILNYNTVIYRHYSSTTLWRHLL